MTSAVLPSTPVDVCASCVHATDHGHWGDALPEGARTHCRDCHRSWRSLRGAHCTACHTHFDASKAFDLHRVAGECVAPGDVTFRDGRPKLEVEQTPYGPQWRRINYRPLPNFGKFG